MNLEQLRKRIRLLLVLFMTALVLSGATAIPLAWGSSVLNEQFGLGSFMENVWPAMARWISFVHEGITETGRAYPFIAYGTDWLAFGHFVIAIAFLGPLRDPVRNLWVVEFGIVACMLVIPTALIFGAIRVSRSSGR